MCPQHGVRGREAGGQQPQEGLVAGTPKGRRGKDAVRKDCLGRGGGVPEAAGEVHVAADANTPGDGKEAGTLYAQSRGGGGGGGGRVLLVMDGRDAHREGRLPGHSGPHRLTGKDSYVGSSLVRFGAVGKNHRSKPLLMR